MSPSPSPEPGSPSPHPVGSAVNRVLDPESLELALSTLQQRIDQLQQSLTQQSKLATLGMITAVIAHEFNNILTPMISYTKFALTGKADEPLRHKALVKALGGAERLSNISKSLLGFARGDETTHAGVLQSVRETLACLSRDLAKDGITLALDIPEDVQVAMNAGHLQQVLMNLIVNARSAMLAARSAGGGGGSRRLSIRTQRIGVRCGRHWVAIRVSDSGPGIPADVLPRIFDPFFSTRHNAAGGAEEGMPRGGTGLGLTICQELVVAAGGTISAESQAGEGTTFQIVLPEPK